MNPTGAPSQFGEHMSESQELVKTLKRCLKGRGMTYADVARCLALSEPQVKRLFSRGGWSMERLEAVCGGLLEMSLHELVQLSSRQRSAGSSLLTPEQEHALADDQSLLTWFYLLVNGWSPDEIGSEYGTDRHETTRILARLDRLLLIDLLPGNQVRLRTAQVIEWRRGGPIWRQYEARVRDEFLRYGFRGESDLLRLTTGELSIASLSILNRKLRALLKEFSELAHIDRSLPAGEKHSVGLLTALRPWVFSLLQEEKKRSGE